ncbi:unnamed protein product [Parascedosporium putredinis]|uniref:MutS protein homolog 3 n=1 Tax=Parascedosporium putredinis TaxID=1442378 RepID=A0A9P1H5W8_9PEZI|nr:unnamed protein product [Parascedosporium putredinis]CAI7997488.1 unnamed protein product [Parascedosporium putredinis]
MPPPSSAKKQASLTSFFSPKSTPPTASQNQSSAPKPKHPPTSSPLRPSEALPARKRPLEEDPDKGNNGPSAAAKRKRPAKATPVNEDILEDLENKPRATPRTDYYLFGSSQDVDVDPDIVRERQELHKTPADEDGGEEDGEEDEAPPPPPKGKKTAKGGKANKLTPMETQFLDIKRKHMDTVLIMEVGYKFRFLGEDARIASKELSIVCIPGKLRYDEHPSEAHLDRFASASIPVHRLPVHAKRLVAAGYKVGVVRQIETAALKKAGDNRNAPFVRKLTNVYTMGTYIDEVGELDQSSGTGSPSGGYLLCITETPSKGAGTDEKVDVGIIAVQPATGDIIYDSFEDGFMRSEIETRLLHISPASSSSTNVFGDRSRVERVPRSKTMAAESHSHVTRFYADKLKQSSGDERAGALLDKVLGLPEHVIVCLSAMITHLTEYGLEHVFDLTKYFQSFSTRSHMLVSGTTLESLEVYRNATDHAEKGSLFWALDKTHTRFGHRLLKKWNQSTAKVDMLETLLAQTKTDLERSLIRIYYGKCTRPELLSVLQTLQRIALPFAQAKTPADTGFASPINPEAARKDDKIEFFREEEQTEAIQDHLIGIASVEQELDDHRQVATQKLGWKTPVKYATVAGIEYLVEVGNGDVKRVPASWIKISGTKKLSRFHTPEVVRLIAERDRHKEALASACDAAFRDLLASISADYQPLRDAVSSLATLDCLLSSPRSPPSPAIPNPPSSPTTRPHRRHPPRPPPHRRTHPPRRLHPLLLPPLLPRPLAYLITGPNMGGKSSFVRAVALLVLLAQIGSFVPAEALELTLCDAIHTRMGARDNLFAGDLVVLDELGRGTSTHDGAAIAHAVLDHVARETQCLTLFITHYQNLSRVADGLGGGLVKNVHMPNGADDTDDSADQEITFLYEVTEGVAHRSYGLNVARLASIPKPIIDLAARKSREMETDVCARRLRAASSLLQTLIAADATSESSPDMSQLVACIEQL